MLHSPLSPNPASRSLVGEIISRFERKGFKLVALKLATPSKEHLEAHYADLKDKKFFPGLITYMGSGPVIAMVWEAKDAAAAGRRLLGATRPADSAPGTIRADFARASAASSRMQLAPSWHRPLSLPALLRGRS